MKNNLQILILAVTIFSLSLQSCSESSEDIFGTDLMELEDNGLTASINNLVPDSILQKIQELDMPIHTGNNPPILNGKYFSSPLTLVASNISTDYLGQSFLDITWDFYNQDISNLTINVDYESTIDRAVGRGSFIVGDAGYFSIFVDAEGEWQNGDKSKLVYIFSGRLEGEDIYDLHIAFFMLDNFGNPNGNWIENGQGRVVIDADFITEKI